MRYILFLPFLISVAVGEDSFITKYEYGHYLYDNPRGIGCNRCHGADAKGKLIATYTVEKNKKKEKKQLRGADIQNISLQKLHNSLQNPPTAMPKYNLTKAEIEALHIFLNNTDQQ